MRWLEPVDSRTDVIVVGAGLAGLVCAEDLTRAGFECLVLEASDGIGGRVRTDACDGFLLDRGFQILLTAYPQVQRRLDLDALEMGYFEHGVRVHRNGATLHLRDPIRHPLGIARTLAAPVGTLTDRVRMVRLVADVTTHPVRDLLRRPEETTHERLVRAGFSSQMIESLWRPLFGGIQLDLELGVSSRRFEVILKMLVLGRSGLPGRGIGAITGQVASALAPHRIRLDSRVARVAGRSVTLESGEVLGARAVVVATEGPEAHRLLGRRIPDPGSLPAACCWFAASSAPLRGPVLSIDGDDRGPMKNLAVVSEVCPTYAPPGRALVACAVPGPRALDPGLAVSVRAQLAAWFGSCTDDWEHLRTDVIRHGHPAQPPPLNPKRQIALGDGLFVCGDHRDTASIQGAMFSGERAASAIGRFLAG